MIKEKKILKAEKKVNSLKVSQSTGRNRIITNIRDLSFSALYSWCQRFNQRRKILLKKENKENAEESEFKMTSVYSITDRCN